MFKKSPLTVKALERTLMLQNCYSSWTLQKVFYMPFLALAQRTKTVSLTLLSKPFVAPMQYVGVLKVKKNDTHQESLMKDQKWIFVMKFRTGFLS